jgi:glycerol-3-phosphate acyltransferase PlsY
MDMTYVTRFVLVVVEAFLLGSIPTSYLIGKHFYGIDPREYGSGATGATNTARSMGVGIAVITALIDISKGWLAVFLVKWLIVPEAAFGSSAMYWAVCGGLIAVIAGHAFSPWIRFKGGKGVAVAAGVTLALWAPLFFIELSIIIVVALLTGYVSVGSITAAFALPFWMLLVPRLQHVELVVAGTIAGLFVIWLHRENIQRLRNGNENKLPIGRHKNKTTESE